jgi:hypothetical protein
MDDERYWTNRELLWEAFILLVCLLIGGLLFGMAAFMLGNFTYWLVMIRDEGYPWRASYLFIPRFKTDRSK